MPFEGEEQSIDDVRTDHAAGEDDGLDEPDLVPLAADEAPLGHRRRRAPLDPLPPGGGARAPIAAEPVPRGTPHGRLPVREDDHHGVQRLQRPRRRHQNKVPQLPPPELPRVLRQRVVDAHAPTRRRSSLAAAIAIGGAGEERLGRGHGWFGVLCLSGRDLRRLARYVCTS